MIPKGFAGNKLVNVLSLCAGAVLLSGLCCPKSASADSIVDDLDSWGMVQDHSPCLRMDNSNPSYFAGDAARVKNDIDGQVGSFSYHCDGLSSFTASV